MKITAGLKNKLKKIKLLILDVDGVLSDGVITMTKSGDRIYHFDVKDGAGIRALLLSGIGVALVSGRKSPVINRRAKVLGIKDVYQEVTEKTKIFEKLLKKYSLKPEETCFIGDDVIDIGVLRRAGVSVAVKDAVPDVKKVCQYATSKCGGRGAIREMAEMILKAQKKWDEIIERFAK